MPVVNIGTAQNLFRALKESLTKFSLDFSNAIAFMSDLYDVGCICHLADLTIKAGLAVLPIDIDQLFIDIFYLWRSLFSTEPAVIARLGG
jgi:hypothetical protein